MRSKAIGYTTNLGEDDHPVVVYLSGAQKMKTEGAALGLREQEICCRVKAQLAPNEPKRRQLDSEATERWGESFVAGSKVFFFRLFFFCFA